MYTEYVYALSLPRVLMNILQLKSMYGFAVSSTGSVKYSKIITFQEKQQQTIMMYWSITTFCNKTLTLSDNHLLYARKNFSDEFNTM